MEKYLLEDTNPELFKEAESLCKNYSHVAQRLKEAEIKLETYENKIENTDSSLQKSVFARRKEKLLNDIAPDQETVDLFTRLYGSLVGRQKLVIEQLYIKKVKWDRLEDVFGGYLSRGSVAWERKKALCVMAQELGKIRQ